MYFPRVVMIKDRIKTEFSKGLIEENHYLILERELEGATTGIKKASPKEEPEEPKESKEEKEHEPEVMDTPDLEAPESPTDLEETPDDLLTEDQMPPPLEPPEMDHDEPFEDEEDPLSMDDWEI